MTRIRRFASVPTLAIATTLSLTVLASTAQAQATPTLGKSSVDPAGHAQARSSIRPSAGVAVVDGDASEWNLSPDSLDLFAELRPARSPSQAAVAKVYLRLITNSIGNEARVAVLVLPEAGHKVVDDSAVAGKCGEHNRIQLSRGDRLITLVSSCDLNSKTPAQFAYVNLDAPMGGTRFAHGFEAAFDLPLDGEPHLVRFESGLQEALGGTLFSAVSAGQRLLGSFQVKGAPNCCTPVLGPAGANQLIECPATPVFTAPTAAPGCSATVLLVSDVTIQECGGTYTQTKTWIAQGTDPCHYASLPVSQTIRVVDTTPPTISEVYEGGDLGCNPEIVPGIDPSVTASDACGTATLTTTISDYSDGCHRRRLINYSAVDECGNHAQTKVTAYRWDVDTTPPTVQGVPVGGDLGCNPANVPGVDPGVTASDDCGPADLVASITDTSSGCMRARTIVYSATDACGNQSALLQTTYTWTSDATPPTIQGVPTGGDLGCNPASVPTVDPGVTASDECGAATLASTVSDSASGCVHSRTVQYSAVDACGNQSSAQTVYTWNVDTTPPTVLGVQVGGDLGCNPANVPGVDPGVTASDECGTATLVSTVADSASGCVHSRTIVYSATDDCGNQSSVLQTVYTWTADTTPPTILGLPTGGDLGCNPASIPAVDSGVTAGDDCGTATLSSTISDTISGCVHSRTILYSAVDACGNQSSAQTVYTWNVDTTPPTIQGVPVGGYLGCNIAAVPGADPDVTVTDGCSLATLQSTTTDTNVGCLFTRTIAYSALDACGNLGTAQTVYTWTLDTKPPTIQGVPAGSDLGCNPASIPSVDPDVSASDDCGAATLSSTISDTSSGCVHSRTVQYLAVDACGNQSLAQTVYTWTADTNPPIIQGVPAGGDLGCNPASIPTVDPGVAATDDCGAAMLSSSVSDSSTGCLRTRTIVYSAVDACGNQAANLLTVYTWVEDATPPTIQGVVEGGDLGCNPATIPGIDPNVTASDDCGAATWSAVVSEAGDGCHRRRFIVYSAVDACGNQAPSQVTSYRWIVDTTPPVIVCNDIVIDAAGLSCFGEITTPPVAFDDCDGFMTELPTVASPAGPYPIGTTTVVWSAVDACGNLATCTQNVTVLGQVCVRKYYDSNANGNWDVGELGIPGWMFTVSDGVTNQTQPTAFDGTACFHVVGPVTVTEEPANESNWVATLALSHSVTISQTNCFSVHDFGNYCFEPPAGGFNIGFWASTAGSDVLLQHDPAWREVLNNLNLRTASGADLEINLAQSFTAAHSELALWLLSANTTNMSYALSAQLAANVLSALPGSHNGFAGLANSPIVVVPGGVTTDDSACIIPTLGVVQIDVGACATPPLLTLSTVTTGAANCGCSSTNGTASIGDLRQRADCMLGAFPVLSTAGMPRTYADCVKSILDMINNNGAASYPCGGLTQYANQDANSCPATFP